MSWDLKYKGNTYFLFIISIIIENLNQYFPILRGICLKFCFMDIMVIESITILVFDLEHSFMIFLVFKDYPLYLTNHIFRIWLDNSIKGFCKVYLFIWDELLQLIGYQIILSLDFQLVHWLLEESSWKLSRDVRTTHFT